MSSGERCAATSLVRDESQAGTASTFRTFVLVQWAGPWGRDALSSARLSAPLRSRLAEARLHGIKPLAVRRHGRQEEPPGCEVYVAHAAHTSRSGPWLERAVLTDVEDLAGVDWAAVASGTWSPAKPHDTPLVCVCTHGRHDPCCAERGRPLAAALHAAYPELTWEVSHIGGDRFAGNVLMLPEGLYYGRLTPTSALDLVDGHLAGDLDLDHLRGRSALPMPAQAAEIFLRRELDERRLRGVRAGAVRRDGELTVTRFETDEASYDVHVRTRPSATCTLLACRSTVPATAPVHDLLAIQQVLH